MRSRLATLLAIALAVAAIAGAGTRVLKSSAPNRPAVHAVLTPKPFAYLGVFEPGAPPGYSPVRAVRAGGTPSAEHCRVLQRVGGTVRHVVRRNRQRS